jgi:hypothetical protein
MIEKALLEPENRILDSLAWVLFAQPAQGGPRIPAQALKLQKEPDATLHDHLGDIYAALKQPESATMEKARPSSPTTLSGEAWRLRLAPGKT